MQQKEIDKANYAARAERTEALGKVKANHNEHARTGALSKNGISQLGSLGR